jgi:hypothetical protein
VAELSFCGITASHQMLLAPNTCTLTVDAARACSTLAKAQPNKIAARRQKDRIFVEYMMM